MVLPVTGVAGRRASRTLGNTDDDSDGGDGRRGVDGDFGDTFELSNGSRLSVTTTTTT